MDEHQVKGTVREYAGKAEQAYGSARERAGSALEAMADRAEDFDVRGRWDKMLARVQENPGTAIGISLLAGAGLGALIAGLFRE